MTTSPSANPQKRAMISVRLTPEEQEGLRAVAERRGSSVSRVIRDAVMDTLKPASGPIAGQTQTTTRVENGTVLHVVDGSRLVSSSPTTTLIAM